MAVTKSLESCVILMCDELGLISSKLRIQIQDSFCIQNISLSLSKLTNQ